jgi:hypothetical protein
VESSIPDRYEKNPLLVVLENYVLDALGLLEPEKAAKLNDMICRTFGGRDWKATVRDQFALPKDTDHSLKTLWKQKQEEADASQIDPPSPEDFARQIADDLIADLGGA